MSKSTISTFELFALIPDAETARKYLAARLWPEGPRCPRCGLGERITARKDGYYRCNHSLYILRPGDVPDGAGVDGYYSRGVAVYQ